MTPMQRMVRQAQGLIERAKAAPTEAERIAATKELWRVVSGDDKPQRKVRTEHD